MHTCLNNSNGALDFLQMYATKNISNETDNYKAPELFFQYFETSWPRRVQPLLRNEIRYFLTPEQLPSNLFEEGQTRRACVQTGSSDPTLEVKRQCVPELHTIADCGAVGWGREL